MLENRAVDQSHHATATLLGELPKYSSRGQRKEHNEERTEFIKDEVWIFFSCVKELL